MEMILNREQKEFLLVTWFDDYDRAKIFGTGDVDVIAEHEIRLGDVVVTGWPKVYMDGEERTSVNANALSKEMLLLISLSERRRLLTSGE